MVVSKFHYSCLLITFVLAGCATEVTVPRLNPEEVPVIEAFGNFPHTVYHLEPGDTLRITYTFHPEVDQTAIVKPDGKITAKMVGSIKVAGMTTSELTQMLVDATSDRLRDPEVIVSVSEFSPKDVYVAGEVDKPGRIPYAKGLTPLQAIIAAGGFLHTARIDSVILVRTGGSQTDIISRRLDLDSTINSGVKEPVFLAPHDVLYVPRTPIAHANLWVRQYIKELLPFRFPAPNTFQ